MYMQIKRKNEDLVDFVKTLKYNQRIIFSDEGNLVGRKKLIGSDQSTDARHKPYGLWYSFGPAWISFLTDHYKDLGDAERGLPGDSWTHKRISWYTHIYKLSLCRDRILKLDKFEDYVKFTKKYGTKNKKGIYWNKVLEDCSGIEARWRKQADEELPWFTGWDCSSGCIWDAHAVRSVKLIAEWQPMFHRIKN